jgi:hypothetical protein
MFVVISKWFNREVTNKYNYRKTQMQQHRQQQRHDSMSDFHEYYNYTLEVDLRRYLSRDLAGHVLVRHAVWPALLIRFANTRT